MNTHYIVPKSINSLVTQSSFFIIIIIKKAGEISLEAHLPRKRDIIRSQLHFFKVKPYLYLAVGGIWQ